MTHDICILCDIIQRLRTSLSFHKYISVSISIYFSDHLYYINILLDMLCVAILHKLFNIVYYVYIYNIYLVSCIWKMQF